LPAWTSRYDSRLSNTSRILIDSDVATRASAICSASISTVTARTTGRFFYAVAEVGTR
jgi:hypothetical protein